MTELNQKIIQSASGETRLKPDEQRQYLGTFKERVVLTIAKEDCQTNLISDKLLGILNQLKQAYPNLTLKINGDLSSSKQMLLLQKAQEAGIQAMVVNDTSSQSPFGLILHTNKAENLDETDIKILFPNDWKEETTETVVPEKKSFWQALFGK